ncbi:MAG: DUF5777 family beta-barrel protein [Vicinamibacterales bacterium]
MRTLRLTVLFLWALASAAPVFAQAPKPPAVVQEDPALDPNDAQPDFGLATLATNLRLPRHKFAFRMSHRFARPLGQGDFGDLASDFFGFDSGALIGLELRYGLVRGGQIGIYRTSDRTIQFFGQYELTSQQRFPLGISILATAEGTDNFTESYSPGVAAVISRELGDRGALYLQPSWVNNTNSQPSELVDHNDTAMLGLGARLRVRRNTYLVAEASPRIAGYDPGVTLISFGIEQRAGGHLFQINFSNGVGTTLANVARGGSSHDDWYIGFNLSRKFY